MSRTDPSEKKSPNDPPSDLAESNVLPTEQQDTELRFRTDLINELKETADKLARDGATIGDLKILSRALKELRYAFKIFTPFRRQRKITVFGSARTPSDHPEYLQSLEFGRKMAEHDWMVVTGAGPGIMEGAHVGAGQEMSMGVNIMLPFEQSANPVISDDAKLVNLKYFFTRKLVLVKEVHAVGCFPGGFGTMDELFETLTLVQTGKIKKKLPILLYGTDYWNRVVNLEAMAEFGTISPEDVSLVHKANTVDDAFAWLVERLAGDGGEVPVSG